MTPRQRRLSPFITLLGGLILGAGVVYLWQPFGPALHEGIMEYDIEEYSLDRTAGIMEDFVHDSSRNALARASFSGEFPRAYFDAIIEKGCASTDSCGIALWFCQDPATQEFFLALDPQVTNYQSQHIPKEPLSATLYRDPVVNPLPASVGRNHAALKQYLLSDANKLDALIPIDRTQVLVAMAEFRKNWGHECEENLAFIAENNVGDLNKCLRKSGQDGYLRYYLGYEMRTHTNDRIQNKFRVILVATDSKGVPRIDPFVKATDPGSGILQSSWPPPPY